MHVCVGVSGRLTPNQHVFWWSPDGPASPLFLVVHPLMIQCSAWTLGRAPIFFRRLMESFRDISLDCSTHTQKALVQSNLHVSECQQNQLVGYAVRLYWQRHVHNFLPYSPLWSEARLFDGQIAADVDVYRGMAVFRFCCQRISPHFCFLVCGLRPSAHIDGSKNTYLKFLLFFPLNAEDQFLHTHRHTNKLNETLHSSAYYCEGK